jgi:DnaJ family protein C protein 28
MFDLIVEKRLRDAQAEGKFDNLSGRGRPLRLDQEDENSEEWAAHHLLKNQSLRPDWLEEDLAIRAEIEQARRAVQRSHRWRNERLAALGAVGDADVIREREWVEAEWLRARREFREMLEQLNRRIRVLNLKVPLERFQRRLLDAETELKKLVEEEPCPLTSSSK